MARLLPELGLDSTPAENSSHVLRRAHEILECFDPFAAKKHHYNQLALGMYEDLKDLVQRSADPLHTAVELAAAGNIIDLGLPDREDVNLEAAVQDVVSQGLVVDETQVLQATLSRIRRVLYLADNAGEIVFDRVLIEELVARSEVVLAVRGAPILNDATMEDALAVGMDRVVPVLGNGSPMIGTLLTTCSEEFLREFRRADLIISKGQANFETLNDALAPVFFILKAKCSEVAREIGVAKAMWLPCSAGTREIKHRMAMMVTGQHGHPGPAAILKPPPGESGHQPRRSIAAMAFTSSARRMRDTTK